MVTASGGRFLFGIGAGWNGELFFQEKTISHCSGVGGEELHSRLMQRASSRDTFWLGRVQAGKGEMAQAGNTLCRASERWQNGDPTSPELARLKQLAETLRGTFQ